MKNIKNKFIYIGACLIVFLMILSPVVSSINTSDDINIKNENKKECKTSAKKVTLIVKPYPDKNGNGKRDSDENPRFLPLVILAGDDIFLKAKIAFLGSAKFEVIDGNTYEIGTATFFPLWAGQAPDNEITINSNVGNTITYNIPMYKLR